MALLESGLLYRKYAERKGNPRLGRHLWLDARSLRYMIENDSGVMGSKLLSRDWQRVLAILDQGSIGSCTANAGAGALGTQPYFDHVGRTLFRDPANTTTAEDFAVQLYKDATVVDGYPGVYPPEDTGSSGLAICKVLRKRKTVVGYRFARSAYGFAQLLQDGPVLVGMPWYEAFFEPDADGFIDANANWSTTQLAGGHEVEAVGLDLNPKDVYSSVITFCNSWGTGWGDAGRFRIRLRTYEQLSEVDIKQFTL